MKSAKKILALLMVAIMAFSACITVSAATKATSLKLNAATIRWAPGKSASFKATVAPANASKTLRWTSSNSKVATVTQAGKLTAKAYGTTTITCATTDGSNLKATCKVTVGKPVKTLKLNCKTINWPAGKSASFKATVTPSDAVNKTLKWTSSNSKVATVSQAGKLTAVAAGTATITCATTDGSNLKATCKVTVTQAKATSLKLNCKTINWPIGKSASFKATVTPANASKTLKWTSSDTKVATVSQSGKLTAVSVGKTTITCATTDGSNLKATCVVTVWQGVKTVKLNAGRLTWIPGRTGTFTATVAPENAKIKTLEWTSSDPQVASISSTGRITTLKVGTTTITCKATDGTGKYATCLVNVVKAVESVTLPESAEIGVGGTTVLTASVLPTDAYNKNLTWTSSDTTVVTVSEEGVVTGISYGIVTVTAKAKDYSGKAAECVVTVIPEEDVYVPVESVSLNTTEINCIPGKSESLKATVSPSFATNKELVWSSSDESVATVTQDGEFTAVSVGTATIICKAAEDETKSAVCKVNVVKPIESISFELSEIKLLEGKTTTLAPIVYPATAYDKNFTWTSSNTKVATVSSTGVVTAKAQGSAKITCTATDGSGKSATCNVTVGAKLTGLELSTETLTLEKGKTGSLVAQLIPSNAITTLSWKSVNPTVATVDGNGKVTAKQAGTATIICRSADGTNQVAYGFILVTDSSNPTTKYNAYFKNYFSDGVFTVSGKTTTVAEGETVEGEIKYGVDKSGTKIRMEVSVLGLNATMITKDDGVYILVPFGVLNYYYKIGDADPSRVRLFDNLIYKGSGTKTIDKTAYYTESFSPYGLESLTIQFCFDSSGVLKYVVQVKPDGSEVVISDVSVSGSYDKTDYEIPSKYKPA